MDTRNVISLAATLRGKANQVLKAKLRDAGFAEIGPAYGSVLAQLFRHGERTMIERAQATRRDKSTVTTLIRRLEKLGYVKRRRHPDDGRSWLVALTEKGEAMREPFGAISDELLNQAYLGFAKDLDAATAHVDRVLARMAKEAA